MSAIMIGIIISCLLKDKFLLILEFILLYRFIVCYNFIMLKLVWTFSEYSNANFQNIWLSYDSMEWEMVPKQEKKRSKCI